MTTKQHITVNYYVINKTYGGSEYTQVNHDTKEFKRGDTRAHSGHMPSYIIDCPVTSKRELKRITEQYISLGYTEVK